MDEQRNFQEKHSREGLSVWADTWRIGRRPTLSRDVRVDVCVIGAGIAGMTTAYMLATEGRSVALLEDGAIGGGMTQFTTAHLTNALDDRYFELERFHGEAGSRHAAASHTAAIDLIERIIGEAGIDCDFRRVDGFLFAPPGDNLEGIERELAAAHRAGLAGVEKVAAAPIAGFHTGTALRFPRQGEFHPLMYLDGLANAIEARGGRIFCDTHATTVEGGDGARVVTQLGPVVNARAIVVATNVPINDMVAIHTKQAPYTTYVVAAQIPQDAARRALYWDTHLSKDSSDSHPAAYHYVRLADMSTHGESLLIVGGEDHKTAQETDHADRFARLERWMRERWPAASGIRYRWSGQVMEPNDGMAFIGRNPMDKPNVYVVTGDSGNGMTHGTIAGILLTDLIEERHNEWESLYNPGRIKLKAAIDFVKENVNVAAQYAKDYLGPGDADAEAKILPATGAVIRHGLKKVAAYRDESGTLFKLSAICPHLGCVIGWNSVQKTWDCPCHGSRFDCYGKVINGPANSDLTPVEEEAHAQ